MRIKVASLNQALRAGGLRRRVSLYAAPFKVYLGCDRWYDFVFVKALMPAYERVTPIPE